MKHKRTYDKLLRNKNKNIDFGNTGFHDIDDIKKYIGNARLRDEQKQAKKAKVTTKGEKDKGRRKIVGWTPETDNDELKIEKMQKEKLKQKILMQERHEKMMSQIGDSFLDDLSEIVGYNKFGEPLHGHKGYNTGGRFFQMKGFSEKIDLILDLSLGDKWLVNKSMAVRMLGLNGDKFDKLNVPEVNGYYNPCEEGGRYDKFGLCLDNMNFYLAENVVLASVIEREMYFKLLTKPRSKQWKMYNHCFDQAGIDKQSIEATEYLALALTNLPKIKGIDYKHVENSTERSQAYRLNYDVTTYASMALTSLISSGYIKGFEIINSNGGDDYLVQRQKHKYNIEAHEISLNLTMFRGIGGIGSTLVITNMEKDSLKKHHDVMVKRGYIRGFLEYFDTHPMSNLGASLFMDIETKKCEFTLDIIPKQLFDAIGYLKWYFSLHPLENTFGGVYDSYNPMAALIDNQVSSDEYANRF